MAAASLAQQVARRCAERVRDMLGTPRFVDRPPAEVVATLLDDEHYLHQQRTMFRFLATEKPVRERRNSSPIRTTPNTGWPWNIMRLSGPKRWKYLYPHALLDIFRRYVVRGIAAERERSALAARLTEQSCHKRGIQPLVLVPYSDQCAPMTSECTAQLPVDLGGPAH